MPKSLVAAGNVFIYGYAVLLVAVFLTQTFAGVFTLGLVAHGLLI